MRFARFAAVLALAAAGAAPAQTSDGHWLYDQYLAWKKMDRGDPGDTLPWVEMVQANAYQQYVKGVVDGVRVAAAPGCKHFNPDFGTLGQKLEVVGEFLEKHPENRDRSAGLNVIGALRLAYPCGIKAPK
ncbi:MAG: Rap1a/Tai family immunity protein [Pseudomonadota bacterium]